jgi:hypothetical protein
MRKRSTNKFQEVPFEKLKNTRAWKNTSILVRLLSNEVCYTCGNKFPFDKLNAGHFREKRGGAVLYFDLRNLRAQCYRCNKILHGAKDIYAKKLVDELGNKILNDLFKEGQKTKVWTKVELEKIADEIEELPIWKTWERKQSKEQ